MSRLMRHRTLAVLLAIVLLIATTGVVAAASGASQQLTGWISSLSHASRTAPKPERKMARHTREYDGL